MVAVKVVASPDAVRFVQERGGTLFVWVDVARCCTGPLTFLQASTDSPRAKHAFRQMEGQPFDVLLDTGGRRGPDEIHVDVSRWPRRRVRAYWNGCAYALP